MRVKNRGNDWRPKHLLWHSLVAASLLVVLSGCGPSSAGSPQSKASSVAQREIALELAQGQLASIRIGIARDHSFAVQVEAVGNVSFTDDADWIQAESTLLGAAATFDLTRKELARVKSLGTTNGIAQKDFEQAVSDEQTAEAAYKAARDALLALGKSDAEINRMVASGRIEQPTAVSRAVKWVNASAVESDSPYFRVGQPVFVTIPAIGQSRFQGTVSEIYSTIDPGSHRVTLRSRVADPGNALRPGMLADLVIEIGTPQISVGVPESGIVREGDGTMTAWVTKDRRHFLQRMVATGLRENGLVQILHGLQQGEEVVTDGAIFLDNMVNAAPSDD
jgi:cobalt-zinc-cadmium efflux system membrane fusion protein